MDVRDRLRDFIMKAFIRDSHRTLADGESLIESGIVDSLGIVRLLEFIHRELGVRVPERDIVPEYFDSVNALTQYLSKSSQGQQ